MATTFTDLPVRDNGQILIDWFNALRAAGAQLESLFGGGFITETQFDLANNQGSPADITGLLFSSATLRGALIDYDVSRKTDTASSEVRSVGRVAAIYRQESSSWELTIPEDNGDDTGITLSITSGGQVQYVSTNISGANYEGKINFKATSFAVIS